jgi:hypothetical protein
MPVCRKIDLQIIVRRNGFTFGKSDGKQDIPLFKGINYNWFPILIP